RNQSTTEEISVGRLREIEGGPRPSRTENRRPNGGRRPALGTRLSTAVTRGIAAWPRDRNASHIASARDPATSEFGAKAKTLDPEPQRPKPVAPAFETASRRGTTGGRIFRMSAVRRTKFGIAMAKAIRGRTGSRVSRRGSLDPR